MLDTEILQRGRSAASIAEGEGGLFREDGGCRVVNDIGGEGICGLHDRNTVRQLLDRFDGCVIRHITSFVDFEVRVEVVWERNLGTPRTMKD